VLRTPPRPVRILRLAFTHAPETEALRPAAAALEYRSPDRTLRDEEANAFHDAVKAALKRELGVEIREG